MVSTTRIQQKTMGFLKPDSIDRTIELMTLIKSNKAWKVTFEREVTITLSQALLLYGDDIKNASWISSRPIHAFILEGANAIKRWLDFVGPADPEEAKKASPESLRATYGLDLVRNVCHASGSEKEARHDLVWLQNVLPDNWAILLASTTTAPSKCKQSAGVAKATTPSSTNLAASAPKKHQSATSNPATSFETKRTAPLAKQPMTKQRPKSSVGPRSSITGSTQPLGTAKVSPPRSTVKAPSNGQKKIGSAARHPGNPTPSSAAAPGNRRLSRGIANTTPTRPTSQPEKQKSAAAATLTTDDSQMAQQSSDEKDKRTEDSITPFLQPAMPSPQATESIDTLASASTTSSQHTRDSDYDAEVSATANRSLTMTHPMECTSTPELVKSTTPTYSGRSTTPEVGALRQRFEGLAHSRSATTPHTTRTFIKRTSSFTPEIAYRIKDLKPKDPTGSRVKSMVNFFMDENLHKWEF
ncbi:hypothetical protein [Absidia glauca]|uniref:Nucleoside diphosphate kinase n=1 Tax=Absidia glauca TaxID=4829 RepID=A0A163JHQ1_ABSGL|nr:hypothetical protein [Absidia glauca]